MTVPPPHQDPAHQPENQGRTSDNGTASPAEARPDPQRARAVLDAALRKAVAVWVTVPDHRPRLVWAVWRDGRLWLATGGGEQHVPGLADGVAATLTVRSPSTRSHLLDAPVVAHLLPPGTPEHAEARAALVEARLNAPTPRGTTAPGMSVPGDPAGREPGWAEVYRLELT
ncbi:hypothetical protein [Goodfellowiella coeruleoviolacea]|uniref:Uncharacterized protein n=1 Tax=Goodfellowiella coeruleoviolacea TaxID=334858 RepID=A0AAE3GC87_9PSEU|nr:hypothetical protein [Goodfellowiella coeruleoviolacea]MCP2165571.1 hypothetical protein [Goodfellowiella coeruleoviolacea]